MLISSDNESAMKERRAGRLQWLGRALAEPWSPVLVARLCGLAVAVFTLGALVWAFALEGAPAPAPEYALGSPMIWRAERAAAATLLAAAMAVVPAQLLAGRLPRSVGREGVEWTDPLLGDEGSRRFLGD